jgi:hypothetical protein
VALGKIGNASAVRELIDRLSDEEGWIRFVAGRVLQEIARREFRFDWIWGTPEHRAKGIRAIRAWAESAGLGE